MKPIYVDSSVLVALLFKEAGYKKILKRLNMSDEVISCNLLEAELLSSARRENVSLASAEKLINATSIVYPDHDLLDEYKKVFAADYLRGADAYHLAVALYLDPKAKDLTFYTLNKQQAAVAKKIGFKVEA